MIKRKVSDQIKESANKKIKRKKIDTSVLIPSGSTMLNLACSDNPFGAFALGRIITLPGGSASGKTMLMLTMLAECAQDERFDNYEFIYDDSEETCAGFDIKYLFGEKLAGRITPPRVSDEGILLHSETIQDFKSNILNFTKQEKSFIYILDSLDSLTSSEELQREYKQALIKAKNPDAIQEIKGSFKTEKAKGIGEALRMINGKMNHTKSVLFIIQQERANIGAIFGSKKTTSGGLSPFFYSSHQVWLNKKKTLVKEARKQKRKIGNSIIAKVTKNKITGKLRDIEFDSYYDYGVDDVSSCIDFLISSGHWKKIGQNIKAIEFDIEEMKSVLIEKIENENLQKKLQDVTGHVWNEIEESVELKRTRKYS